MTKIGIISDTHGWLDEAVFRHFESCDEIWHAGDFGSIQLANSLKQGIAHREVVLRGVYGNIDAQDVRSEYPEQLVFIAKM